MADEQPSDISFTGVRPLSPPNSTRETASNYHQNNEEPITDSDNDGRRRCSSSSACSVTML